MFITKSILEARDSFVPPALCSDAFSAFVRSKTRLADRAHHNSDATRVAASGNMLPMAEHLGKCAQSKGCLLNRAHSRMNHYFADSA